MLAVVMVVVVVPQKAIAIRHRGDILSNRSKETNPHNYLSKIISLILTVITSRRTRATLFAVQRARNSTRHWHRSRGPIKNLRKTVLNIIVWSSERATRNCYPFEYKLNRTPDDSFRCEVPIVEFLRVSSKKMYLRYTRNWSISNRHTREIQSIIDAISKGCAVARSGHSLENLRAELCFDSSTGMITISVRTITGLWRK